LKAVTGKQLCRVLERKGWVLARISGSHHIYMRQGIPYRLSIPVHGNKPLKIGLLKHFMKLADIEEAEL